jgi:hypothetical protein
MMRGRWRSRLTGSRTVVELMAKRKSPAAVAIELGVPIKTVKKIVQERKRK